MKAKRLIAVSAAIIMCTSFVPAFTAMPVSAAGTEENQSTDASGFRIVTTDVKSDGSSKPYTLINVSYLGMGAGKLAKEDGSTLAFRIMDHGKWYAWTPVDAYVGDEKGGLFNLIQDYSSDEVQFCVTKQPYPKVPAYNVDLSQEGMNEAISDPVILNNSEENKAYKPAPYIIKATPAFTSTFNVSKQKTAKVTLKFSEQLEQTGPLSVSVSTKPKGLNYSISNVSFQNGSENVTVGDVNYKSDYATVTFDMELDDVYDAQFADYYMQLNGLVGITSRKVPNSFGYTTSFYDCMGQIAPFCSGWGGPDQKIYMSQPLPVSDTAIDPQTFDFNRNNYDQFTTNIFLVAQRGDGKEATFALKYNHANGVEKLRQMQYQATLAVPYPDGFNARETNVTFHAYKFINKKGEATKRIELPTRITDKGLEVSQKTFGFEQK